MFRTVVFLFFLFSGLSGLIYEVVWTRLLTTVLGNTVYAVSTVLAAFMAGLSIGSFVAGRTLDSRNDALRLYAILELCIGIGGFVLTLALIQTGPLYVWLHQVLSVNQTLLSAGRYLFALLVLVVPTTLMGATLPVLSRVVVDRESHIGVNVGILYTVNTLGAAAGSCAAGFLFIGSIGCIRTALIAAIINLTIGTVAWFMRDVRVAVPAQEARGSSGLIAPPPSVRGMLALVAFALSGCASMGYEVIWTRILVTYMGNTVYAFSTMLTTFLLGLALGSVAMSSIVTRVKKLFLCFGLLQVGIGGFVLGFLYFAGNHVSLIQQFISPYPVVTNIAYLFFKALVFMLPPTILMGASFPVATRLYATHISSVARNVGELYAWNTIACIVGSTLVGFFVIPQLGFEKSLMVLLVMNIGIGAALFAAEPMLRGLRQALVQIVLVGGAVAGVVLVPRDIIRSMHERVFHNEEQLVFYKESPYGIVEVLDGPSRRRLLQDDLDLAGTSMAYLSSQKPLGHLPMLLHPAPRRICIIGFGAGGATSAVSTYPCVERIAIAELNKTIIATAPLFHAINRNVLSDPRCQLVINDGRHFLLTTRSRFDAISVDLLWPQAAGAGSLYTREFYRLCSDRLNDQGIMVEWVHTGLIPKEYLRVILNTARQVFPYVALWTSRSFGHLFLVCSKDAGFTVNFQAVAEMIAAPAVAHDLAEIGFDDPSVFFSYFIADRAALDDIVGNEKRVNTDDLPLLEYRLPYHRTWSWNDNAVGVMRYKRPVLPLLRGVDSSSIARIKRQERTMAMVLESKVRHTRGDQWGAITLCTDAFRENPANPEAYSWYAELKHTMKCLSDSGKAPPAILNAFDTSAVQMEN